MHAVNHRVTDLLAQKGATQSERNSPRWGIADGNLEEQSRMIRNWIHCHRSTEETRHTEEAQYYYYYLHFCVSINELCAIRHHKVSEAFA